MKADPIIAVKDVTKSSKWYQQVFECNSFHGGDEFDILMTRDNDIFICLHKWGAHDHPTMKNPTETPGNGLILYFRTEKIEIIRENLRRMNYPVEEEIKWSPNSRKNEFSLLDPDGYYLTISEYHTFEG